MKSSLCGSPGFPLLEEEVYVMPFLRVLGQLRYLHNLADVEEAERTRAEAEARAKAAASKSGAGTSGNPPGQKRRIA